MPPLLAGLYCGLRVRLLAHFTLGSRIARRRRRRGPRRWWGVVFSWTPLIARYHISGSVKK